MSLSLQQKEEQKDNVNLRERRNSFNTPGTNGNSPESQMKYENDKLKLALAQRYVFDLHRSPSSSVDKALAC